MFKELVAVPKVPASFRTSKEALMERYRTSIAAALFFFIIELATSLLRPGPSLDNARNCCWISEATERYWSSNCWKMLVCHAMNGLKAAPPSPEDTTNRAS